MIFPDELLYTKEHEWVRVEDSEAVVGVTDYAQQQLGDVVYVELPESGTEVVKGDTFGVVESVKAVSDLYCPLSGTVTEINEALVDKPELVNQEPYGSGWMIKIELSDEAELDGLLSAREYEQIVAELSE